MKNKKRTCIRKTNSVVNLFDFYGEFLKVYVWIAQLVEQRTENPCDSSSSLLSNKFYFNEKLFMKHLC